MSSATKSAKISAVFVDKNFSSTIVHKKGDNEGQKEGNYV